MHGGKKSTAEQIVYGRVPGHREQDPQRPAGDVPPRTRQRSARIEVKSRRVGGATYQVPIEVRPERATSLAMRWLVQYARSRSGRSMPEKLADELIDAANEPAKQ